MLGAILAVIGIILILLSLFYFEKKKIWLAIGIILVLTGGYFLLFSAPAGNTSENNAVKENGLTPGVGPKPADFEQTTDTVELLEVKGTIIDYYDLSLGKTYILVFDGDGREIEMITEIEINLEGAFEIEALGYFEEHFFVAEQIFVMRMLD